MDVAAQPAALPFTPVTSRAAVTLWVGPPLEFPPIEDHTGAIVALDSCFSEVDRPTDSPISGIVASTTAPANSAAVPERSAPFVATDDLQHPIPVLASFPIVLEGISAGRAKPVQVFTATLRAAAVVDIPRYEALPLRPVMIVEPSRRG